MTSHAHDWHPSEGSLVDYAGARTGPIQADSIEAHLVRCAGCREALRAVDPVSSARSGTAGDPSWSAIADRIDEPSRWSRTSTWWLRVTIGSPLLCAATAALVLVLVALPLLVAAFSRNGAAATFLALAPLAPVAGAVLAYRPEIDPAGGMAPATPTAGARLVLIRAAVVAAAAVPSGLLVALALPAPLAPLLGWLLPGLGLSLLVLGIGTRTDPTRVAAAAALAWAAAVTVGSAGLRRLPVEEMLAQLFVNQTATQLAAVAAAAVGALLVATRPAPTWRIP